MKHLSFFTLYLFGCSFLFSQNHVFSNAEAVNFGDIDINKATNWTTARTSTPGKFSNYGAASFRNGSSSITLSTTSTSWINGYVKHYATLNNTTHIYTVGGSSSRMFLSTSSEKVGHSIAVCWIGNDFSSTGDLTGPNAGSHSVFSLGTGILSVNSLGQWDWEASPYTGTVVVNVKLPSTNSNSNLRLVGWNGVKWINLGTTGSVNGILTGNVSSNITALAIGSTTANATLRSIEDIKNSEEIATNFKIYPNPSKSGYITLDFNSTYVGTGDLSFIDELGKLIFSERTEIKKNNILTIDISKLSTGIYFIQLTDDSNNTLAEPQKLIVQ